MKFGGQKERVGESDPIGVGEEKRSARLVRGFPLAAGTCLLCADKPLSTPPSGGDHK